MVTPVFCSGSEWPFAFIELPALASSSKPVNPSPHPKTKKELGDEVRSILSTTQLEVDQVLQEAKDDTAKVLGKAIKEVFERIDEMVVKDGNKKSVDDGSATKDS